MGKTANEERSLCTRKKSDIAKEFQALCAMVCRPKYVCRNCGRAAARKKWLCKPTPLVGS